MAKVLVTGVSGFIGSHLAHALLANGHTVYGVDNLSNGKFSNIEGCFNSGDFVFVEDDFTKILPQIDNVDIVIHLAAVGSVPRSIAQPELTFEHNVHKFHQLLVSLKESNCRRLIYASSSSVLGGGNKPNPLSPYALSKFTNELYAQQFFDTFGIHSTGLRFFNVYGARQRADSPYAAVIPKMIHDEEIKINAPGTQSRDFTYVKDVVSAILSVMELRHQGPENVFDVGFGESRNLYELLGVLKRLLPERKFNYELIEARAGDVMHSLCNNTPLKEATGWRPKYDLETGLSDMLYGSGAT